MHTMVVRAPGVRECGAVVPVSRLGRGQVLCLAACSVALTQTDQVRGHGGRGDDIFFF